ncbi:hypothetical protein GC722_10125 [Auraticoccus sp. F435]|uniref:DUF2568 domain-containing protein n=1 Tax=Auraticoccus cholistanensis TaxID=2656650 RepID=A0A6A9UY54_9ACTN|nr:hypothetical protein [Auraticoccus cholistanensis]MVA76377.1 hypothetical protein [Auraticoccus cholistanensis]
MTTTTAVPATARQPRTLVAARVLAGLVGAVQLAGAIFFLGLAREEAVWIGPLVDVPVVALTLTTIALKLVFALAPGIRPARRITVGLLAVALGVVLTVVKVAVYDEAAGGVFLAVDAVVVALLLLARRER